MSGNGQRSKRSFWQKRVQAAQHGMTETLLRPCSGGGEPECHGATCLRHLDRGRRCSTDSIAGRRTVSGTGYFGPYKTSAMTSGIASTAPSIELTSTPLAEKGGRRTRNRSFAWRSVNQGPLGSRRSGVTARFRAQRGSTTRQPTCQGACSKNVVEVSACRQGLRFGCISHCSEAAALRSRYTIQWQPSGEAALRQALV